VHFTFDGRLRRSNFHGKRDAPAEWHAARGEYFLYDNSPEYKAVYRRFIQIEVQAPCIGTYDAYDKNFAEKTVEEKRAELAPYGYTVVDLRLHATGRGRIGGLTCEFRSHGSGPINPVYLIELQPKPEGRSTRYVARFNTAMLKAIRRATETAPAQEP
jgi:hypothetical protein